MKTSEDTVRVGRVTIRETTLLDAVLVALESGEFVPLVGQVADEGNGRCVWGVAREIAERAGLDYLHDLHPRWRQIQWRAGALLGYEDIAAANDAGVSWKLLAPAIRAARIAVERGVSHGDSCGTREENRITTPR